MTTTNPSKRRAFLTGVGSILDLQGAATYRRMQSLMPPPSAEDFPQRSIGTGISSEQLRNDPVLLAQITAYLEENHLHVPLLMPDIDKMSELRSETPSFTRRMWRHCAHKPGPTS
ncbi:hypothetical protein ACN4DW_05545 [Corynebacterium macclintockiae]|uniref:Uncharacterized protein n=1 Tax=Corynebacterium macclintockiae TaxID=2913501 RepID=A0A9X3M935_9CORY|nr:hypothetical protein [Corynebacterium macclintockiae]MCZ9305305.1 hypothetical protein [Corynebacterium macclintockiae]